MIKLIELKNFMAHKDTVIELTDGLNVLVGPNNSGKSAVVTALQILCGNERGGYMVRHGEQNCSVTVETEEGHRIEWRRENDSVTYFLNGEPKDRLQGNIPEELHDLLRLESVPIGDDREAYDVHFGEQKSPIFLINEPGSRAAAFFASSSDSAKLLAMQRLHQRRVRDARQEKAHLQSELRQIARLLDSLTTVPALMRETQQLKETYEELQTQQGSISALNRTVETWRYREHKRQRLAALTYHLASLESPPELEDEEALETLVGQISAQQLTHERCQLETQRLDELRVPPDLFETAALDRLLSKISKATVAHAKARDRDSALAGADRSPPELLETRQLQEIVDELARQHAAHTKLSQADHAYADLSKPPQLESWQPLQKLITEISQLEESMKRQKDNISAHDQELHAMIDELEVCPFCGTELDEDHLMSALESESDAIHHDE